MKFSSLWSKLAPAAAKPQQTWPRKPFSHGPLIAATVQTLSPAEVFMWSLIFSCVQIFACSGLFVCLFFFFFLILLQLNSLITRHNWRHAGFHGDIDRQADGVHRRGTDVTWATSQITVSLLLQYDWRGVCVCVCVCVGVSLHDLSPSFHSDTQRINSIYKKKKKSLGYLEIHRLIHHVRELSTSSTSIGKLYLHPKLDFTTFLHVYLPLLVWDLIPSACCLNVHVFFFFPPLCCSTHRTHHTNQRGTGDEICQSGGQIWWNWWFPCMLHILLCPCGPLYRVMRCTDHWHPIENERGLTWEFILVVHHCH